MTSSIIAPEVRPVPNAPNYTVSADGVVTSHKTSNPKTLSYRFDGGGRVTVSIDGKPVCVANLVREVFGLNLCPKTLDPVEALPPTPAALIKQAKARLLEKRQKPPQQPAQASEGSGGTSATLPPS